MTVAPVSDAVRPRRARILASVRTQTSVEARVLEFPY